MTLPKSLWRPRCSRKTLYSNWLKLKCFPTVCEFWNFSTYSFLAICCLASSSFFIHMHNLVFSNKLKGIPKQISNILSPSSYYLLVIRLHKFKMPQASWTILSAQLNDTTVLCSKYPSPHCSPESAWQKAGMTVGSSCLFPLFQYCANCLTNVQKLLQHIYCPVYIL